MSYRPFKNAAGQTLQVFAFDVTTNEPVTGDEGNITGAISKDDGAAVATDDVNPDEVSASLAPGFYKFNATQAEVNADTIDIYAVSTTADVSVIGVPTRVSTQFVESLPIEKTRDSDVVTDGTETGTSANTLVQDGVDWELTSVAAGIDAELIFNIGTEGTENPSTLYLWSHFDSGQNRVLQLQAYNFDQATYENLGVPISNTNANDSIVRGLGNRYVKRGQGGTPGVDGDVRIRFLYDLTVSNKVNAGDEWFIDKAAVYYVNESVTDGEIIEALLNSNPQRNYTNAAIEIDTENGQPGTDFGLNGIPGNPVNNLADAATLNLTGGYDKYIARGNSVLTFTTALPDFTLESSQGTTIDLNGQDFDDTSIVGGVITGIALGATTGLRLFGSVVTNVTMNGRLVSSRLIGTLTANGDVLTMGDCSGDVTIDCANIAGMTLVVAKHSGNLILENLANDASVFLDVNGSYTLADAASTATVAVSGNSQRKGAGIPTGITLDENARVDALQINDQAEDVLYVKRRPEITGITDLDASAGEKIDLLGTGARNRGTQNKGAGATKVLFADNNTTPIATWPATDDGTTFDRGKGV